MQMPQSQTLLQDRSDTAGPVLSPAEGFRSPIRIRSWCDAVTFPVTEGGGLALESGHLSWGQHLAVGCHPSCWLVGMEGCPLGGDHCNEQFAVEALLSRRRVPVPPPRRSDIRAVDWGPVAKHFPGKSKSAAGC